MANESWEIEAERAEKFETLLRKQLGPVEKGRLDGVDIRVMANACKRVGCSATYLGNVVRRIWGVTDSEEAFSKRLFTAIQNRRRKLLKGDPDKKIGPMAKDLVDADTPDIVLSFAPGAKRGRRAGAAAEIDNDVLSALNDL